MFVETVSYSAAFFTGLLSFFTPCILPLIPAYFTFITGFSLDELTQDPDPQTRKKVILSTVAFVLGFSLVFILLGASASYFGGLMLKYKSFVRIIGGVVIILMGIHLTGIIRFSKLEIEKRIHIKKKPIHLLGTLFVGMAFAAGWTPCLGPLIIFNLSVSTTLGSILNAAGNPNHVWLGVSLLATYSAGLAIPFLILSVFINFILVLLKKASRVMKYINYIAGILLILLGVSLMMNRLGI